MEQGLKCDVEEGCLCTESVAVSVFTCQRGIDQVSQCGVNSQSPSLSLQSIDDIE